MVRVETDISLLNRIANDDAVRPFLRPDGEALDFAPIAGLRMGEMGGVVLSNGEDAFMAFVMTGDQIYQGHLVFGPTCRGRKGIDTGKEMIAWMFAHNARRIWGLVPRWNKPSCLFTRLIGGKEVGGDAFQAIFDFRKNEMVH